MTSDSTKVVDRDSATASFEALKAAVVRSGGQSAFARLCGVSQAAVWKWLNRGKALPGEHVLTIERETGVSKHELRPDLYPLESTAVARIAGGTLGAMESLP